VLGDEPCACGAGYRFVHEQTPLMEYDFAVRNLATDFRDGVRLTRLHERLTCALPRHISRLRVL
jgi:hypothetical protein